MISSTRFLARWTDKVSFFLAQRMYRAEGGERKISRPAIVIAMLGIGLGLAVMIISVAVAIGFKQEVRRKITGLTAPIQLNHVGGVADWETRPLSVDAELLTALNQLPTVAQAQRYSTIAGMIKTDEAFQGMLLKGIGPEFDISFLRQHLVEGEIPCFSDSTSSNQVVLSQTLAQKMRLSLGQSLLTYYIAGEIRARKLTVVGIFQTHITEFDNRMLLTDIHTVNKLNGWDAQSASGIEILLPPGLSSEEALPAIYDRLQGSEQLFYVQTVEQLHPQIFAWLELLDLNVWVILILMMGVAGFLMISGLLILIIERTQMIGILKAMGADNATIRKTFLWFAVFLISKGMLWGNVVGLGFYFVQQTWTPLHLDPSTYYVHAVPVSLSFWVWLLINLGTLLTAVCMLIGPSYLITKIRPATSIRYE